MKWVGLAAGPAGGGTVFIKVVIAIWFQVVITAAFLPEADGTAATGVAAPREMISSSATAMPRDEWRAALDVEAVRMAPLRVHGARAPRTLARVYPV